MLKFKEWLRSKKPEIQFKHDFKKFVETGRKTVIRISDGAEFFEGQVIEMLYMRMNIIRFHNDHIHVDVVLEVDNDEANDEAVPHTCEINYLYHKKNIDA